MYSRVPPVLARQALADLVLLTWVVAALRLRSWVEAEVSALADPLRAAGTRTSEVTDRLASLEGAAGDLPLVGGRLAGPLGRVTDSVAGLESLVGTSVADVEHLGSRLGLLTLVVLVVLALALWLPWRVRGVLRARRVRALAHDPRLLALKRLLGPGGAKAPARALDEVLAGGPLATELAAKEARRAGVVLGPRDHSGQ